MNIDQRIHNGMHWLWLDACSSKLKPKRFLELWSQFWWKYIPGQTVEVKWPRGYYPLDDIDNVDCETTDPNTAYRWYLEKHIGKQGWDWDWRIGSYQNDSLLIRVRTKHVDKLSLIVIKWQ